MNTLDAFSVGTFEVDETGDYSSDVGLANLKKRINRRLITSKGGFVHLPDYGVGVFEHMKRLSMAATRQNLADEARRQIKQEPDVAAVSVVVAVDPKVPGLVIFQVAVKTVDGVGAKMEFPITVG
jgi:phage baseplate assembly protein W